MHVARWGWHRITEYLFRGQEMTDDDEHEILRMADPSRRNFVKSVLAGGVFTAPLITTFSVSGVLLGSNEAEGQFLLFS